MKDILQKRFCLTISELSDFLIFGLNPHHKHKMTVTTEKEGGKLTIFAEGKFTTTAAPELEKALKSNIDGVTELVFDFEKVDYLASAGLRVLLSAAKVMKKQGTMKIIHATEPVMDVFTFTGMADALDIEAL